MTGILEETDPEIAVYITRRMIKEARKFRPTEPYHSRRKCQDHRCLWHAKGRS